MEQFNEKDFAEFIKRHLEKNGKTKRQMRWLQRTMKFIQIFYDPYGCSTSIGCINLSDENGTAASSTINDSRYLSIEKMNIAATSVMNDIVYYYERMNFAEKNVWSIFLVKCLSIPKGQLRRYAYLLED